MLRNEALLVVDVQNDFITGTLPVPGADAIIPNINHAIRCFERDHCPVFYTRCWHIPDHPSFVGQGGPWPAHCIIDTPGAAPPSNLYIEPQRRIIAKGIEREAYSGFDNTTLHKLLQGTGITTVTVCGLATDYCVKATVVDARRYHYGVLLLANAIAGVSPATTLQALTDMHMAGAINCYLG